MGCTVLEPLQAGTHAAGLSALPARSDLPLRSEMNLGSSMAPSAQSQPSPHVAWADANGPPSLAAPTLYFLGPLLVQILLEITDSFLSTLLCSLTPGPHPTDCFALLA